MPIRAEDVWRTMRDHKPIDNWICKTPVGSCRSELVAQHHSPEDVLAP